MSLQRQAAIWLGIALFFGLSLYVLRGVLLPFVMGMAIAYFLDPVVDRLEDLGLTRNWATGLIAALGTLALILALLILVPVIQDQVADFIAKAPIYMQQLRELAVRISDGALARYVAGVDGDMRAAFGDLARSVIGWFGRMIQSAISSGLAIISFLSLIFVTPIVAFYLLLDWDRMIARIDSWLPRPHAPTIRALAAEIDELLAGFVRGQVTVCLVLGTFYATALSLLGLEFGLMVGLVSGLISFVPFMGALTGLVLSGGLALVQFWPDPVMIGAVLGVFFVGQALEGNVLTPWLVGSRVRLHPVWVIFALFAFGALLGFLGVLLAVPLAAVIGVLARFAIAEYKKSPLYTGGTGAGD